MFVLKKVHYKDILSINELTLPEKKVSCIIGESGSGKTTLLKLLNQLISHDGGEIWFQNHLIEKWDPITLRRNVVMVPQTPVITSESIRENLNLGATMSDQSPKDDEELKNVLEFMKLDKNLNQNADNLSSGEKQRLSLARVMLMDPSVFLLDEPSSALDEDLEDLIISKFIDYAVNKNKTVIMVTHSKKIGQKQSDVLINIDNGKAVIKKGGNQEWRLE
ncbi:ABC transporter ATP-binding protein [Natranaerobius thermophilus]|uniref:ABC transporter related n=1 Tax=Natranaerobius thermophilus (strain ATCC BAA-1301 / DSM 18059 / JW/NM-WN-LF) TaxID=457570 RepID=B2A1I3_NATTJ|nr:ATP-binding cassette domain-containing protein [Natranaerobius thermophilus]ACB84723.1 ABC transporter related [Natranaerobius thermophilus JW/NM-WN-LF]